MTTNKKLKYIVNISVFAILCFVLLLHYFGKKSKNDEEMDLRATDFPKASVTPYATKEKVTAKPGNTPTIKPTSTPEPTPYVLWETRLGNDEYRLSCNSQSKIVFSSLDRQKSILVECDLGSFSEASRIGYYKHDLDYDGTEEIILSYQDGLDFSPSYKFLFIKVEQDVFKQIPNQEFFPELTLKNTKPGMYTIFCKETGWKQSIIIEDERFYHDSEGNTYDLYLHQPYKVEKFEFLDGKFFVYTEMRIDGYTGFIGGRYTCSIHFSGEKLVIQDQKIERLI